MRTIRSASGASYGFACLSVLCVTSCASRSRQPTPATHAVRRAPRDGRLLIEGPRPTIHAHAPTPATHVQNVALPAETEAARRTPRTGTATPFQAALQPVAFRTTDGLSGWRVNLGAGRPLATPAVADGSVFVGGGFGSHEFYSFDANTGETRWALRVSDDGPTAAVVEDGVVAFNTESCTLFVVAARDGHPLWSRWLGDPLMSQPGVGGGHLYMAFPGNGGHRLIAFDLREGNELWRVPIAGDVITAPVVYGDSVYATTFDGTVYRHRASDGGLAWREQYHATSAPWLFGDQVFVAHHEEPDPNAPHAELVGARRYFAQAVTNSTPTPVESVGRLSGGTGTSTQSNGGWAPAAAPYLDQNVQHRSRYTTQQHASDTSVGFATAPATAGTTAAAANIGQGTVRGLWEFQGSRPCVIDGRLFVTQGSRLLALDADTGHELWRIPLEGELAMEGGHLAAPPSAAGGRLYLATVRGDVVVILQETGQIVRTIHLQTPMRFQPSISHGRLYVGSANGELISLDLGDATADGWPMWGGSANHNGVDTAQ